MAPREEYVYYQEFEICMRIVIRGVYSQIEKEKEIFVVVVVVE